MAIKRGVKVKEGEKLDDATIQRVIDLLEDEKEPITKKSACEILNISYNTTRLATIINDYKDKQERRKKNFQKNKGQPLSDYDISYIVKAALSGEPISEISESIYRSPQVINNKLNELGVPRKERGYNPWVKSSQGYKLGPKLLPEECIIKEAKPGQIVWSAQDQAAAEVVKYQGKTRDGVSDVYQVYVLQPTETRKKAGFYASYRIEELGSLAHLEKYIDLNKLT